VVRLAFIAALLFPIQAVVGGLQILTGLSGWTQTLHLALGAVIWALLVGLVSVSYLEGRAGIGATAGSTGDRAVGGGGPAGTRSARTSH
jgi:heme A synthase